MILFLILIFVVSTIIWVELLNKVNNKTSIQFLKQPIKRNKNCIDMIKIAISSNKKLKIIYKSSYFYKAGEETCRIIQPIELKSGNEILDNDLIKFSEFAQDNLYLKAYCELRNEERHFRLDRIKFIQIIEN